MSPARVYCILALSIASISLAEPATTTTAPTSTQPAAPKAPDGTVAAEKGTLDRIIDVDGSFVPLDAFEAKASVRGYQGDLEIAEAIEPNSAVKAGDVLIKFDPTAWQQQLALAETEVRNARANLERAEADLKLGANADALVAQRYADTRDALAKVLKMWDDSDAKAALEQMTNQLRISDYYVESSEDELEPHH